MLPAIRMFGAVTDNLRFAWRGLMLDISRTLFSKDDVKCHRPNDEIPIYTAAFPTQKSQSLTMQRHGSVIRLQAEKIEEYKQLHRAVWPEVLKQISASNIRNYSIYLRQFDDGQHYLFSYFEYTGSDFDADMAAMAADPATQRWWDVCKPCHSPFESRGPNEWWASMEEVFHCD
jgi:L-rhamnose mutarotase